MNFPKKKYNIIYADPPWNYQDKNCNGAIGWHYKGMDLKDIKALPVKEITEKDSVLFLWATYPMIKEALEVIDAWGFKYKSIAFQWIKLNKKSKTPFYGLGRWTRGNTEPCLLATKGKPQRKSKSVFQIIESPIRRHSEKPHIAREKIVELMGYLPRIELFARNRIVGWDSWGDELQQQNIIGSDDW